MEVSCSHDWIQFQTGTSIPSDFEGNDVSQNGGPPIKFQHIALKKPFFEMFTDAQHSDFIVKNLKLAHW